MWVYSDSQSTTLWRRRVTTTMNNNRRRMKIMTMGGNDRQRRCSHHHREDERGGIIPRGATETAGNNEQSEEIIVDDNLYNMHFSYNLTYLLNNNQNSQRKHQIVYSGHHCNTSYQTNSCSIQFHTFPKTLSVINTTLLLQFDTIS